MTLFFFYIIIFGCSFPGISTNLFCWILLRHICVTSAPREPTWRTLLTVSERENIIQCDQQFEQSKYAQTFGHDVLWLPASIAIDGFPTISSTQFYSHVLDLPAVWFFRRFLKVPYTKILSPGRCYHAVTLLTNRTRWDPSPFVPYSAIDK